MVAGTIKSADGKTFFLDLDNGILEMDATLFKVGSKTVEELVEENTSDLEDEMQATRDAVSNLTVEADSIRSEVYKTQNTVNGITGDITKADTRLTALEQTSEQVQVNIQSIEKNGVDRVTTKTGYTFNEIGMEVDKTDSSTKTVITSNGMDVYSKAGGEIKVLSATSEGVEAKDLHAKTYLIIGGKCRFEKYGDNRVGCYWIGGE